MAGICVAYQEAPIRLQLCVVWLVEHASVVCGTGRTRRQRPVARRMGGRCAVPARQRSISVAALVAHGRLRALAASSGSTNKSGIFIRSAAFCPLDWDSGALVVINTYASAFASGAWWGNRRLHLAFTTDQL